MIIDIQPRGLWKRARKFFIRRMGEQCLACAKCGKCICGEVSAKEIEIHHIDSNPTNNMLGNLIPLCKDCHVDFHSGMWDMDEEKTILAEYAKQHDF